MACIAFNQEYPCRLSLVLTTKNSNTESISKTYDFCVSGAQTAAKLALQVLSLLEFQVQLQEKPQDLQLNTHNPQLQYRSSFPGTEGYTL